MASGGSLEEGPSRRRRPSTTTPNLRVRQTILKGPSQLLRALGFPHSSREVAIARWVEEADLAVNEGEDSAIVVRWICEKREQIITAALEELIECRQQSLQRDAAAEAVVKRLNEVYEECSSSSIRNDAVGTVAAAVAPITTTHNNR